MIEDKINEVMLSDSANLKIIYLAPMGKRTYKNHRNGHGIEVWACEDCKKEIDNIKIRCQKPRFCKDCTVLRTRRRSREAYRRRKHV